MRVHITEPVLSKLINTKLKPFTKQGPFTKSLQPLASPHTHLTKKHREREGNNNLFRVPIRLGTSTKLLGTYLDNLPFFGRGRACILALDEILNVTPLLIIPRFDLLQTSFQGANDIALSRHPIVFILIAHGLLLRLFTRCSQAYPIDRFRFQGGNADTQCFSFMQSIPRADALDAHQSLPRANHCLVIACGRRQSVVSLTGGQCRSYSRFRSDRQ